MFDLEALEAAGFEKQLSTEEWEQLQQRAARLYGRTGGGESATEEQLANVRVDYVLERGNVRITTEQNTQEQTPFGITTVVKYPEIVVIESTTDMRRVTCDASDTQLILLLAERLEQSR